MDEMIEKKINVCKRMGGNPVRVSSEDVDCKGVDKFKFEEESEKE